MVATPRTVAATEQYLSTDSARARSTLATSSSRPDRINRKWILVKAKGGEACWRPSTSTRKLVSCWRWRSMIDTTSCAAQEANPISNRSVALAALHVCSPLLPSDQDPDMIVFSDESRL